MKQGDILHGHGYRPLASVFLAFVFSVSVLTGTAHTEDKKDHEKCRFPEYAGEAVSKGGGGDGGELCRNSLEVMAMAGYQTGDTYQINSKLGYSYFGAETRFDLRGSFQEISSPAGTQQSADAMAKVSYPVQDEIYAYLSMNGNWRNERGDFYYFTAGPGVKVTPELTIEIGAGQVFVVPGDAWLIGRGAFDFRYRFAENWLFQEKFEVLSPIDGPVNYIMDSDTTLAYRVTNRASLKAGVTYNGIDNNTHRVQMLVGMDYKF